VSKKRVKEFLESQRKQLEANLKKNMEAEKGNGMGLDGVDVLGPRDELERKRMLKEIEDKEDGQN
jgi:hypothetical protein